MNDLTRRSILFAKIIAWLQIAGGVFGLLLLARLMINTAAINGAIYLIFILWLSLYAFSIHCGIKLLNPATRNYGFIISLINQGFQFFQFCIFGSGLSYASGINFAVGIKKGMSFDIELSAFNMAIHTDDAPYFMINIFAIAVFVVLLGIYRKPATVGNNSFDEIAYTDPEVIE